MKLAIEHPLLQDSKISFEMGSVCVWSEGAGKEKTFLNQSLIFSLLTAEIGKKIKCQGIIYKTSQYVWVTGCRVWLAKR